MATSKNKHDLAEAYFPNVAGRTLLRQFRSAILNTPGLLEELRLQGYKPHSKVLNPAIVEVFYRFWGTP